MCLLRTQPHTNILTRTHAHTTQDVAVCPKMCHLGKAHLGLIQLLWEVYREPFQSPVPTLQAIGEGKTLSWGEKQQLAFDKAKSQLTSSSVLMHFDASPYGVGAVLSHQTEEGERPIAFASRTLSPAERKYAHLDKEGLYIIFGVKKFHGYLFGRKFVIRSDHKPLQRLFDNTRAIPQLASARLQRWSLILSAYDYTILYRSGEKHANADSLSRLPLPEPPSITPQPTDIILLMKTL